MVDIAHQYKIRVEKSTQESGSLFGNYWESLNLDLKNAEVRYIPREEASKIILEYEWLGTMSPKTRHHYGIFFDGVCGGVVCFGVNCTSNHNAAREFGLTEQELYTLARGACVHWSPKGAASKLISSALRLLKQDDPNVKVVIAYSDTDAGEIGTVYQATNWLYIGNGCRQTVNYYNEKLGRMFDERVLHKLKLKWNCTRPEVRARLEAEGWIKKPKAIKHKYIFILGNNRERKEIMKHITVQPYPKRDAVLPAEEVSR